MDPLFIPDYTKSLFQSEIHLYEHRNILFRHNRKDRQGTKSLTKDTSVFVVFY